MSPCRFELATESHEPALRRVMADVSMPGSIEIAFEREPDYCRSNCVLGPEQQTIVCRDTHRDNIVGLATRSVRNMHYQSEIRRIGYLGSLRLLPSARKQSVLSRGYRFVRELHESDPNPPDFYITTIAEGNTAAIRSLTTSRANLPTYRKLTTLHTLAISRGASGSPPGPDIEVHQPTQLPEIAAALRQVESHRNLEPDYVAADFEPGGTFDGLNVENTFMLTKRGQLSAIAGIWNQRHFRQSIVRHYSTPVQLLRPLHNLISFVCRRAPLPRTGRALELAYLAFPWVRDSDPSVFRRLIKEAQQRLSKTVRTLLTGFCENDPLLPVARRFAHFDYKTTVYAVSWNDMVVPDNTIPYYLELGCL